jgi:non-specific serine/threonine protein kinase/serine/threonine-protein kinase
MTPEQFARVEGLFEKACDQPADRRLAWLREQSDDPDVLCKVEGMLAHDAVSVEPIDAPAMGAGFHVGKADEIEQRLRDEFAAAGRYRIEALLGEGGFGSVYRAAQVEPVRRRVALKVIKLGMDTRRVLARFEAERQTLAMMNHPGIAKIQDAGITESGRSYFVMELVEGKPITAYCDENRLDMRARLTLFAHVCEAIQHAHQKGVLHRDIKPSNVLVTLQDGKSRPVVIDFGIARALDDESGAVSLMTEQGQMIGTPEYMSPEQANGSRDIDTRTDIYSLGVLLYELLTGNTPFDRTLRGGASLPELQRLIREADPPTPSTRVRKTGQRGMIAARGRGTDPSTLSRLLQGDLDWIVMKAIEKQRDLRYESVDAFAADIERYLNDEPVLARPQSAAYRFRKFARRNRGAVAAAVAIVILLVSGVIGTTYGMVKARREAQVARNESAIATAVSDFLNYDLLAAIEVQKHGHDVTMREILDAASQRLDGRFDDQPRVELAIRCSLGRAYKYLGAFDTAAQHLERGLELSRTTPDADPRHRIDAPLVLADVFNSKDRPAQAEPLLNEALPHAIALEGETGMYPLLIMNALAQTYRRLDKIDEAESLYQRVIEVRRGVGDEKDNQRELLTTMSNLATLYMITGRLEKAESLMADFLSRAGDVLGPEHPVVLKTTFDWSKLLRQAGRLSEAEASLVPVLDSMKRLFGQDHPHTCLVMGELSNVRRDQGHLDEALRLRLESVEGLLRTLGDKHESTQHCISELVTLLETMNRLQEAADWRARLAAPGS